MCLDVNLVRIVVLFVVVLHLRRVCAWSHDFVSVLFSSSLNLSFTHFPCARARHVAVMSALKRVTIVSAVRTFYLGRVWVS